MGDFIYRDDYGFVYVGGRCPSGDFFLMKLEETIETFVADDEDIHPAACYLATNFPNPFNTATRIMYSVASPAPVRLVVYNSLGQLVKVVVDESKLAGAFATTWDGTDREGRPAAAGVYLARITIGDYCQSRKLLLLK